MDLHSPEVNTTRVEDDIQTQAPAQSETQPKTRTVYNSNPNRKSEVWKEIESVGIGVDGKERGRCIHCSTTFVIGWNYGTSHLRRHLRSCQRKRNNNKSQGENEQDVVVALVSKSSCRRDGLSNVRSQKRQRGGSISKDKTRSGMLDCHVCFKPLTIPIFQCDNGHLACSSCCLKLSNKCPTCSSPIGYNSCKPMENVLESVLVHCQNGCTENVSYEKECTFSQCSCPALDCDYTGSYINIYSHFVDNHRHHKPKSISFECGGSVDVQMKVASDEILVLLEVKKRLLFAVQCFSEPRGVYVTVRCIAPPSASEVEKFAYRLYYSKGGHNLTYESPEVKKVLEVRRSQTPQDDFMFVPHWLMRGESLEIKLCIELKLDGESGELPDMGSFTEEADKRKTDGVFVEKEATCREVKQEKLTQVTQSEETKGYFELIQAEIDAICRSKMQAIESRRFDYGSIDADVGQSSSSQSSQYEKSRHELNHVNIKMEKL